MKAFFPIWASSSYFPSLISLPSTSTFSPKSVRLEATSAGGKIEWLRLTLGVVL
jgi:hypothetical protein